MSQLTRAFFKKAITKIVSEEYIKPADQKLISQQGIIDILTTLDRGTPEQLKRIYDKYTTAKTENKPIQQRLAKKALKNDKRETTLKKVQEIANRNSKRTKEEAERRRMAQELPQIDIQDIEEEEEENIKKGRNQYMEGNVPENINDDIDKSIFYLLIQLKKFIKSNRNNKPCKISATVYVQFEHIPSNKYFILRTRPFESRKVITETDEDHIITYFDSNFRKQIQKKVMGMPSGLTFRAVFHYEYSSFKMSNNRGGSWIVTPKK